MKVLFVYTDIHVRGGALSYPFGIGMISAVLKRGGHSTRMCYIHGAYRTDILRAEMEAWRPDVVAFAAMSPQYPHVVRLVKDLHPFKAFTVMGGKHPTLAPECVEEVPGLNAVCIGEAEYPMLALCDALQQGRPTDNIPGLWVRRSDGTIAKNPPGAFCGRLDELPFPDREIMDYQAVIDSDFQVALFMFSRGCPYQCTFCANHALRKTQEGVYVRFRSVENCLAEIREVTSRYKVRALYFNDDCFTARRDFLTEFCRRYQAEFQFPFDINARPETLTDETCVMLKQAGCRRVSIGVEHGDEKFREEVLGRRQSNDRIAAAFAACRRAGLKTKSFNIVGFPGETAALHQATVDLNARINPDSVIIGVFEPYPGTRLAEICKEQGLIDPESFHRDYYGRTDTMLQMPQFPREEVLRCFRLFAYRVYRAHSLPKALALRLYYSRFGEPLLRLLAPFRNLMRRLIMGV